MATDGIARIVLSAKDETALAFARAKAGLGQIRAQANSTAGVFGTLGTAVAAAFGGASLIGAVEALDRLDDLAEKSGIAAETLSELRFAGETTGTSLEELAKGVRKLADNMASAAGGSKEASAAFEKIGVNVKSATGGLKGSDEVLLQIADKFRGYTDGAEKSALATALFGKAGEALIPLLNQGSAGIEAQTKLARQLGAVYSGDLAKSAADFNDNLKRIGLAAEGAKVSILEKLLPGLNLLADEFIRNAKNSNLFVAAMLTLKGALAFDFGLDKLGTLQRNAADTSGEIARLTNILSGLDNVLQREPGNEAAQRRATNLRVKLKALQDQAVKTGEAIKDELAVVDPREANAETQRLLNRSNAGKTKAPITDKSGNKDEGLSQFTALLDKLKERAEVDRTQLSLNRQLTESEKFALDVEVALTGAKSKLSDEQKKVVRARLEEVRALDQQLASRELLRAAADADFKAEQATLDLLEQSTAARAEENRSLLEQIQFVGLTAREVENLRVKRLEDQLVQEQGALVTAKALGLGGAEAIALRTNIELLQRQIALRKNFAEVNAKQEDDPFAGALRALKNYSDEVAKAGNTSEKFVSDSLKTLEDGLTGLFTGKGFDAKAIVDSIISEFVRLQVIKPLLNSIFGSGGGTGTASIISAIFSSFVGKAGGGRVTAGSPVMTGERGRELFVPQVNGTIIPASAVREGGGSSVVNNISVGAGVTRNEVMSLMQAYGAQLKGEILNSARNGGAFAR